MFTLLFQKEIDSTNTYLKNNYQTLDDKTCIYALHQTAGKGRLGRAWKDDHDSLVFSILLKDHLDPSRINLLPLLTGVSVYQTLLDYGITSLIKWPNDILINDRKCTGILLEAVSEETDIKALVIGVGINLNDESFPEELSHKATSLYLTTKKKYDQKDVLLHFLAHFETLYQNYLDKKDGTYLSILNDNSYLNNKEVYLNYYGEDRHVLVKKVNEDGRLLVEDNQGKTYLLEAGEVTLEQNYHK